MQTSADEMRTTVRNLDQDIRSSWIRCLEDYRLVPARISKPYVLTRSELRDQSGPIDDLLAIAAPEIKRLFARLLDSNYLVTVASQEGINVSSRCDYQMIEKMESLGILAGANWSEERQGTNGIGTCIKLKRSLSVVRNDHFSTFLKELSCSVVPVFGPMHALRCVINTTTDRPTDRAAERILRTILEHSARRIENAYFSRHYPHARIVKLSTEFDFSDPANEVRLALNDDDEIVDATSALSATLKTVREQVIGRPISEVLGSDFRNCTPNMPVHLQSEHPGQTSVFAVFEEVHPALARPMTTAGGFTSVKANNRDEMDALQQSVFRLNPSLVADFPKACRVANAGLPLVLRGEAGSGREAFARLLFQASRFDSFRVVHCSLDLHESIARTLTDRDLKGIVYLEDAELLRPHLGQVISRLLQELNGSDAPAVCFIAGCGEDAALDGALEVAFLMSATTVHVPAVRRYPNRAAVVEWIFEEEARKRGATHIELGPTVREILLNTVWPGNLHQLRLVVRHILTMCDGTTVLPRHLPQSLWQHEQANGGEENQANTERSALLSVLSLNRWNVSKTADYLGTSRATLNRKIRALGLIRPKAQYH